MINKRYWLGDPGSARGMIQLPSVNAGGKIAYGRGEQVHNLINGGTTIIKSPLVKRQWQFQRDWLSQDEQEILRGLYSGLYGTPPYRLLDPNEANLLDEDASTFGSLTGDTSYWATSNFSAPALSVPNYAPPVSRTDGFESNTASSWAPQNCTFVEDATHVHNGSWAAKLVVTGSGSDPTQAYARNPAPVQSVVPNVEYGFLMWVFATSALPHIKATIDWFDGAGTYVSSNSTNDTTLVANTWTPIVVVGTCPVTARRAGWGPTIGNTPGAGVTLWVDDTLFQLNSPANSAKQGEMASNVARYTAGLAGAGFIQSDTSLPMYRRVPHIDGTFNYAFRMWMRSSQATSNVFPFLQIGSGVAFITATLQPNFWQQVEVDVPLASDLGVGDTVEMGVTISALSAAQTIDVSAPQVEIAPASTDYRLGYGVANVDFSAYSAVTPRTTFRSPSWTLQEN